MKIKAVFPLSIIALGVTFFILSGCGPKEGDKGPSDPSPIKAKKGGNKGQSELDKAVERLNAAVGEGNEKEIEELVVEYTLDLLLDVVGFSPEEKGGAFSNPTTADFLDFEKRNNVEYVLAGYDEEEETEILQIVEDGTVVAEGPVSLVSKNDMKMLDFEPVAQLRLEKVQSEGILRGKYIDVIDKLNEAVSDGNTIAVKKLVTIDTLNLELKVRSYDIKHKKNLSLKLILDTWNGKGALFEVSKIDINAQTAQLKLSSGDDVIYEGQCKFITEIGKLKVDFSEILEAKLAELEEKYGSKKKKKKKKKK